VVFRVTSWIDSLLTEEAPGNDTKNHDLQTLFRKAETFSAAGFVFSSAIRISHDYLTLGNRSAGIPACPWFI
jgi:hypothetical protein